MGLQSGQAVTGPTVGSSCHWSFSWAKLSLGYRRAKLSLSLQTVKVSLGLQSGQAVIEHTGGPSCHWEIITNVDCNNYYSFAIYSTARFQTTSRIIIFLFCSFDVKTSYKRHNKYSNGGQLVCTRIFPNVGSPIVLRRNIFE